MAKNALYKAGDIRVKTPDELSGLLLDLRKEQFNLRFQRATGQQEGTGRVRECRREIARVKTIQAEKIRSAIVSSKPAGPNGSASKS
jgi:large subunit ribosomal protein L29